MEHDDSLGESRGCLFDLIFWAQGIKFIASAKAEAAFFVLIFWGRA